MDMDMDTEQRHADTSYIQRHQVLEYPYVSH